MDFGGIAPVSNGNWNVAVRSAIVRLPGETESGSADFPPVVKAHQG